MSDSSGTASSDPSREPVNSPGRDPLREDDPYASPYADPDRPTRTTDTGATQVINRPVADERGRKPSHLTSLVLSVVLTPLALIAYDYALAAGWGRGVARGEDVQAPVKALVGMGIAALLLLVVASASRLSGLGPLVAGLLWGVAPAVLFAEVPFSTAKRMLDIADPYDRFTFGLISQSGVFVVVGALLVGVGLFGRWRRTKVA